MVLVPVIVVDFWRGSGCGSTQDAVTRQQQQWSIVRQVVFSPERIIDGGMRSVSPYGMPHALIATYVSQKEPRTHTHGHRKGFIKISTRLPWL